MKIIPATLNVILLLLVGTGCCSGTPTTTPPASPAAPAPPAPETAAPRTPAPLDVDKAKAEVETRYAGAQPEVQECVLHTATTFGQSGLWLNEDAFASWPAAAREQKIQSLTTLLAESGYGRHLCTGLAEASALKDLRLVPGLMKIAGYHQADRDYDCRPKWMAAAALARQESEDALPLLISLVDHGNPNTRLWARAALSRQTGKDFGKDKQAWAQWRQQPVHPPIAAEPLSARLVALPQAAGAVDLLERYPTSLTAGDRVTERAREWEFANADVFHLSRFQFQGGNQGLKIETGPADVGVGHCADGAVWAVVIPQGSGTVSWMPTNRESAAHLWLRFHPREVNTLFPPETVSTNGSTNLASQIRSIADAKMLTSFHANERALIPEPNVFIVNVDTTGGARRNFMVDTAMAFTSELAGEAFDRLWEAFDRDYAMFVLRPELDWNKSREQFRPRALASKSTPEFAEVCAEMLKPLRDLHVWLKVSGTNVPVYDRPAAVNSNPFAHRALLGELHGKGPVQWAVTPDQIGFIATYSWFAGKGISEQCDEALAALRDTRALIVDARLNRGGSEGVAMEFAGRFLANEFTYASHRRRNGPAHTDLSGRILRTARPRGPWRYDRPVLLLIGEKCISSNESFVGMMTGATNVTTMGDHTAGSSGNPQIITLPFDMTVGLPVWIAYLPDGTTPLDERGYQPQIQFEPQPGAFEGNRDGLLAAALDRLRQAPLPAKPIEAK